MYKASLRKIIFVLLGLIVARVQAATLSGNAQLSGGGPYDAISVELLDVSAVPSLTAWGLVLLMALLSFALFRNSHRAGRLAAAALGCLTLAALAWAAVLQSTNPNADTGDFNFTAVADGVYSVNYSAPGYEDYLLDPVIVSGDMTLPDVVLQPEATATPTNTPTDAPTSTPTNTPLSAGDLVGVDDLLGNLRYVPAGSFTQGSDSGEAGRQDDDSYANEVQFVHTLTRNIAVMETEVTRVMWAGLQDEQPSLPADPSDLTRSATFAQPVQRTTWYETVLFANLASVEQGLVPAYYTDANFTIPVTAANYLSIGDDFHCNFDANGYRLPTEGEWEYFARAGTTTTFSAPVSNYNSGTLLNCTLGDMPELNAIGWYCATAGGVTHAPGGKAPNPWGIYDLHGNVFEVCWDWVAEYPGDSTDYTGAASSLYRAARGGSWGAIPPVIRCAYRLPGGTPTSRLTTKGFRLVRTISDCETNGPACTATPVPTNTPTSTGTSSPTTTPTNTATETPTNTPTNTPHPNLIMWWPLNETSGDVASDQSGFGRNGNILFGLDDTVEWATEDGRSGLDFLGNGFNPLQGPANAVTMGIHDGNPRSVSIWLLTRSVTNSYSFLMGRLEDSNRAWGIRVTSNSTFVVYYGGNEGTGSITYNGTNLLNTWNHFAITYDGTDLYVYLNGVQVGSRLDYDHSMGSSFNPNCNFFVSTPGFLNGMVSDVRLYNTALSQTEVELLACDGLEACATSTPTASPTPTATPAMVMWWPLNETSGIVAHDQSGFGRDGAFGWGEDFREWTTYEGRAGLSFFDNSFDPMLGVATAIDMGIHDQNPKSVALWVLTQSVTPSYSFIMGNDTQINRAWGIRVTSATEFVVYYGGNEVTESISYPGTDLLGTWNHFAITYDGTDLYVYLNGVQVGSRLGYSHTMGSAMAPRLSWHSDIDSQSFLGIISDVRLYSFALSQNQVEALACNLVESCATSTPTATPTITPTPTLTATSTPTPTSHPNLQLWYKLDEASGTTAADSSGNARHGTLNNMDGATDWVTVSGRHGLDFDGVNDYVDSGVTPVSIGLNDGNPKTVSLWAYVKSFNSGGLFSMGNSTQDIRYFSLRTLNVADQYRADFTVAYADLTFSGATGQWAHFAQVYDGTHLRIYANGVLQLETEQTLETGSLNSVQFGRAFGISLNGILSDIRVYNTALSLNEVELLACDGEVACATSTPIPTNTPSSTSTSSPTTTPTATPTSTSTQTATNTPTLSPTLTPTPDITSNLQIWYKLDEASGTTAADSSGNARTGTLNNMDGATDWVTVSGRHGLDFDGFNDFVNSGVTPSAIGLHDANPKTISLWAYVESFNSGGMFSMGNTGTNNRYFSLRTLSSADEYRAEFTVGLVDFEFSEATNQWAHFAQVYDGTELKIYANGVLQAQEEIALSTGSLQSVQFGRAYGLVLNGILSDIRVYSRALSPTDVAELAEQSPLPTMTPTPTSTLTATNTPTPTLHPNLIMWWPMTETSGETAFDQSGNNRNGNLFLGINTETWGTFSGRPGLNFPGTESNPMVGTATASAMGIHDANPRSISVWVMTNQVSNAYSFIIGSPSTDNRCWGIRVISETEFRVFYGLNETSGSIIYNGTDLLGAWNHFAITYDGTDLYVYLNGVEVGSRLNYAHSMGSSISPAFNYFHSTPGIFNGVVSDLRIYNTALSLNEVEFLACDGEVACATSTPTPTSTPTHTPTSTPTLPPCGNAVPEGDGGRVRPSSLATTGWEFTVLDTIEITHLAFADLYNDGSNLFGDGLVQEHTVGIWDTSETLLVSASVPSGTDATYDGSMYRYVAVTPVTLPAGTYRIGATHSANTDWMQIQGSVAPGPSISVVGGYRTTGGTLSYPTTSLLNVLAGPSFIYNCTE